MDEVKKKLEAIGAKLVYASDMEQCPFLAEGFDPWDSSTKTLRVRKVDGDVEITYKDPATDSAMTVSEETKIQVDNYENALKLLEKLGFQRGKVFRKHREHYSLGKDVHFELDTLENLPTYLEVETQSERAMHDICGKLGLDISEGKRGSIVEVCPHLLDEK